MNPQNDITHLQAQAFLHAALNGSLNDAQSKDLDQHLSSCTDCREYALELNNLDQRLTQSLQARWPVSQFTLSEFESTLTMILTRHREDKKKESSSNTIKSIGWVALVVLLIAGLVWTIKTLAPIPSQVPAGVLSPEATLASLQPSESPFPTDQVTLPSVLPTTTTADILPKMVAPFPSVQFDFDTELPTSPETMIVYQQQLSDAVTSELARQVASQWGINGGMYTTPSEGMADIIYEAMDSSRSMRFLNFPDQFIYEVGYVTPDYGSALMDNGTLPPFDEQVRIATNFLDPFGILDLPYQTKPLETERGMVAFVPLLDGYPVVQEIGVDRSNIGWIDVKVNTPGQVTFG